MDVAGDDLRQRTHMRTLERIGGKKRRLGLDLVEILNDRERLREHVAA